MKDINDYIGKIICADCLDVLKQLPDKSIDLVLTDPPYGILGGAKAIGGANIVEPKTYTKMEWDYDPISREQIVELIRVSKNQIIFGYNHFSDFLSRTKCFIAWDKACQDGWNDTFADGELAWTSFNRPAKFYRLLWKGCLRIEKEIKRYHPTQKPIRLMKEILIDFSENNFTILDPFAGSGTTLVAAELLGRKWIGIEISPEYCKIAEKRVKEAREQFSLFEVNKCNAQ